MGAALFIGRNQSVNNDSTILSLALSLALPHNASKYLLAHLRMAAFIKTLGIFFAAKGAFRGCLLPDIAQIWTDGEKVIEWRQLAISRSSPH